MMWALVFACLTLAAYSFATWHARLIIRHVPIPHGIFAVAWFIVGSAAAWFIVKIPAAARWFEVVGLMGVATSSMLSYYSFFFRLFLNYKRGISFDYLGRTLHNSGYDVQILSSLSFFAAWRWIHSVLPKRSGYDLLYHVYVIRHRSNVSPGVLAMRTESCLFVILVASTLLLEGVLS